MAEKDLPDETSPAAAEGTFLHECISDESMRHGCDAEQLEVLEVMDGFLESFEVDWDFEVRLKLTDGDPFLSTEYLWGTVDAVGIDETRNRAIIGEFKSGRMPVARPAENWQVAVYSAMVLQEYDHVSEVEAYVIQPRLTPHWKRSKHVFTASDEIVHKVAGIITQCQDDPDPYLEAGDHCTYCRARHICPELLSHSKRLPALVEKGLDDLTPAQLLEVHDQASLLDKAIQKIQALIKQKVIDAGGQLTAENGVLEIVESQGARQVSSPQQAYEATAEAIPHDTFMSIVTVPVGKLESAYAVHAKKNGRFDTIKAAKAHFGEVVECERKPATRKLVRREVGDGS